MANKHTTRCSTSLAAGDIKIYNITEIPHTSQKGDTHTRRGRERASAAYIAAVNAKLYKINILATSYEIEHILAI